MRLPSISVDKLSIVDVKVETETIDCVLLSPPSSCFAVDVTTGVEVSEGEVISVVILSVEDWVDNVDGGGGGCVDDCVVCSRVVSSCLLLRIVDSNVVLSLIVLGLLVVTRPVLVCMEFMVELGNVVAGCGVVVINIEEVNDSEGIVIDAEAVDDLGDVVKCPEVVVGWFEDIVDWTCVVSIVDVGGALDGCVVCSVDKILNDEK